MDTKRGVSPLIATVLLVMIVVSIGAAVMLVIRGISDDNLEKVNLKTAEINCGTDVDLEILAIGTDYQICKDEYTTENGVLATIMTNKGSVDVEDFKLTVIGPAGIFEDPTQTLSIEKDETKALNFSFNGSETGGVRQVRITPIISGVAGQAQVACIDVALTWSNDSIPLCPLP